MGFRFSRRVSILPGLKLCLSRRGVSLSAGVRGADVNFGPRGMYANLGIPGTGLSYRQRIGGGRAPGGGGGLAGAGRPPTARQQETLARRTELQDKVAAVEAQLQQEAADYAQLLDFWQPLPSIATEAEWSAALAPRPFASRLAAPPAPDWAAEQAALLQSLTAAEHTGLNKFLPAFVSRSDARSDLAAAWPAREAEVRRAYDARLAEHQQQVAVEAAAWDQAEARRMDWIQKLLAGDLEETQHTVAEVLAGLRLPVAVHCDFFLQDARVLGLRLDLPPLDEVIPVSTREALKNGDTREVRRTQAARQTDYTRLALGVSLFFAAELFSYLPLAGTIRVAAQTRRPRLHASDPLDCTLLDADYPREAVRVLDPREPLTALLARLGARLAVNAQGGLNPIEPADWFRAEDCPPPEPLPAT